jgi:hypothetical protein
MLYDESPLSLYIGQNPSAKRGNIPVIPIWYIAPTIGSIVLAFTLPYSFKLESRGKKSFFLIVTSFYITTRIISSIYLYGVIGYSGTWDLRSYFFVQGDGILNGLLPYRDFPSSASPLFSYLLTLPLLLWNHPLAINILFAVFDLAVLVLGFYYTRDSFGEKKARLFVWQYSLIPVVWLFVVFWNQDEAIMALFLLLSMWCVKKEREDLASVFIAFGFLFTKFLFALFALAPLSMFKNKVRGVLVSIFMIVIGYIPFVILLGSDILQPIFTEAGKAPIGANIWVIPSFFGIELGSIPEITFVALLVIVLGPFFIPDNLLGFFERSPLKNWIHSLMKLSLEKRFVLISLIFMTFAWKSLSFYIGSFIPIIIIVCFLNREELGLDRKLTEMLYYVYCGALAMLYYGERVLLTEQVFTIDWWIGLTLLFSVVLIQTLWIWLIIKSHSNEYETTHQHELIEPEMQN